MTVEGALPSEAPVRAATTPQRWVAALLAKPAAVFVALSLLFGMLTIAAEPPLRGPDEKAHFLRAYGLSRGEIVPAGVDHEGRKGLLVPARLYDDLEFFEDTRYRIKTPGFSYREVLTDYAVLADYKRRWAQPGMPQRPPVFVLYTGSEGYAPTAYLPYIAAALTARAAGLDFLGMFYLMRTAGLLAMTAAAAYAIAVVPNLKWAFLLIAMLPAALYGRAVISADGAVLSYTLLVTALCLRAAQSGTTGRAWERALWMTLCILSKPPQIAFAVLELMVGRLRDLRRAWPRAALVILPGLILGPLWVIAASAEVGVWRVIHMGRPEEFDPVWKLRFMLEHPLHFPMLLIKSLDYSGELWKQLIGVLGWLDNPLRPAVYPALSALLVVVSLQRLALDRGTRARIAAIAALAAVSYFLAVWLIFFLTWTPVQADRVLGVQGRYFIVMLPPLVLALAALLPRALPEKIVAAAAVIGAVIAGGATLDAIVRITW
jgi:hypothetical protein